MEAQAKTGRQPRGRGSGNIHYFGLITISHEVSQQSAPLSPELVGTGQTAVASDHTQVGDAQLHQVTGRLHTTLPGAEVLAAGAAYDRSSLTQEGGRGHSPAALMKKTS